MKSKVTRVRDRSKSVNELMIKAKGITEKHMKTTGESEDEESLLLVHLAPRSIESDSVLEDVNVPSPRPKARLPKRRMTTEIKRLLEFQENMKMGIDQLPQDGGRVTRKRRNTTATLTSVKSLNIKKTRVVEKKSRDQQTTQARILSHMKQGDINEAMLTLRTGFSAMAGTRSSNTGVDNEQFTFCPFPCSYSFVSLANNMQQSLLTPQHVMLQLEPGAERFYRNTHNSSISILTLSGSPVVEIISGKGRVAGEMIKMTSLSLLKLKSDVHYTLRNESQSDAICFMTSESS